MYVMLSLKNAKQKYADASSSRYKIQAVGIDSSAEQKQKKMVIIQMLRRRKTTDSERRKQTKEKTELNLLRFK